MLPPIILVDIFKMMEVRLFIFGSWTMLFLPLDTTCIIYMYVMLRLRSKCMPALFHGLETCPLRTSTNNSLDFVVSRFLEQLII